MLYVKENPVGLDAKIQSLQNHLYTELNQKWQLQNGNVLEGYGRVYVNQDQNKRLAEAYISNNEYQNVLVAEKSKFFFLARQRKTELYALRFTTNVELCFMLDLGLIKPDILHRADEEVQSEVVDVLNGVNNVFVESIDTDPRSVFNGLTYSENDNMQPYHFFKINLKVDYFSYETCNCGC